MSKIAQSLHILNDLHIIHYKKTGKEKMSKKTSMLTRVMSTMMSKKMRYN